MQILMSLSGFYNHSYTPVNIITTKPTGGYKQHRRVEHDGDRKGQEVSHPIIPREPKPKAVPVSIRACGLDSTEERH